MTTRQFATAFTIGAFLISSVTGILMFFHWDTGFNKLAHEWLSWILVAGVGLHIYVNWTSFSKYFKNTRTVSLISFLTLVLILSFLNFDKNNSKGSKEGVALVMETLSDATIEKLLLIKGKDFQDVESEFLTLGIKNVSMTSTVSEIAGNSREKRMKLISILLK